MAAAERLIWNAKWAKIPRHVLLRGDEVSRWSTWTGIDGLLLSAPEDQPRTHRDLADSRQRMIAETEAFLNWAFHRTDVPRIPRVLVKDGGFAPLLRHHGARAAVRHWWQRTLDRLGA